MHYTTLLSALMKNQLSLEEEQKKIDQVWDMVNQGMPGGE
jgi:hypothetical protein